MTAVVSNTLTQLTDVLHQLAQTAGLCLKGRVFASLKVKEHSPFGDEEDVLYIRPAGLDFSTVTPADLLALRQVNLVRLARSEGLDPAQVENELAGSRVNARAPFPPYEALFHAVLPAACILTARVDAILALALAANGQERLQMLFQGRLAILPSGESGLSLAKACHQTFANSRGNTLRALLLPDFNLAVMGETPEAACDNLIKMASEAETCLKDHSAWDLVLPDADLPIRPNRVEIATLRKTLSEAAGFPLILTVDSRPLCLAFSRRADLTAGAHPADADPGLSPLKPWPMPGRDVEAYLSRSGLEKGQAVPRPVLDPDLGMAVAGRTAAETAAASELYLQALTAILRAEKLQGNPFASVSLTLAAVVPAGLFATPTPAGLEKTLPFTGEVALVTGGASGIGKACVESLLARGAAVVTLDINAGVAAQYDRPDYLGMVCDLTDEAAILNGFETMARRFGGMDMLVLNAGIFPAGIRIEALETAAWQKVMRINLDSNLVLMREAQPLLKEAPRYGRVLVNASKNVLAPGAGAAAYSASKAAVTQLARVAALEWGKDKVRVNLVHPDAIFDTGIWTEEVLKTRAAHYGMTVQQYKTRNVLGVELNSHYVGELVAEMLGPLFEKITGAQIPVDGGSDRVI